MVHISSGIEPSGGLYKLPQWSEIDFVVEFGGSLRRLGLLSSLGHIILAKPILEYTDGTDEELHGVSLPSP